MGLRNEAERFVQDALREGRDELDRYDAELSSSQARAVAEKLGRGLHTREFQDRILRYVSDFIEDQHERIVQDLERDVANEMQGRSPDDMREVFDALMRSVPDEAERRLDELERVLERWLYEWKDTLREIKEKL